ncbi:hypothetical protein Tco_0096634 [Tanacetum coccineum]
MAKSNSSSDNEVYDDSFCSKSCKKNTENLNKKIIMLNEELFDSESDLCNYKRGLSQVKARLVEFKINESKFCEKIRVLERDLELKDYKIENLTSELEEVKKERDGIDSKLEKFVNASKDLDQMLKSKKSGLPEFADNTVTNYTRPTPSVDVTNDVRSKLDGNNLTICEHGGTSSNAVSKPIIKFVKETGCPSASKVNNTDNSRKPTVKYAEMYRNTSQSPRVQKHVWNNARRVNHHNSHKMSYPHPKRNFVPKAVLMKTGMRPLNAARPGVGVNAAKQKAAYNAIKENKFNVVKASAC